MGPGFYRVFLFLFLPQVKEYHQDCPCKTTKLGGFQQKLIQAHDYYFREKGKHLTGPHHFGFDPLHENIQMQEIRARRFYETFVNAEHVFTKLNSGGLVYFQNAICLFQILTVALSNL